MHLRAVNALAAAESAVRACTLPRDPRPGGRVAALGLSTTDRDDTMSDSQSPKRQLIRRRRANVKGGRQHSHRVLVTPEEEARLVRLAEEQRVTVPRLLVEAALARGGETPTQRRHAMVALFGLRRSLAGLATNVNQLAAHANASDAFPRDADAVLPEIRRAVERIDQAIDELGAT
jgi:Bacterial mobilisation protein (MobC)